MYLAFLEKDITSIVIEQGRIVILSVFFGGHLIVEKEVALVVVLFSMLGINVVQ